MGSYPENSRTLPSQTPQSVNEGDRLFIWTNKLQKLVEELRRESAAVGGEDMNNPRIVELHSRIAELVREGNQSNGAAGNGISAMRDVANTSPPAYELG
jgi:hypothetical protein